MPRSLQEVLDHAEELERRFAERDPSDARDAAPLHALRDAVTERASNELRIAEAVAEARQAGLPRPARAQFAAVKRCPRNCGFSNSSTMATARSWLEIDSPAGVSAEV